MVRKARKEGGPDTVDPIGSGVQSLFNRCGDRSGVDEMTTLSKWCHINLAALRGQIWTAVSCWSKGDYTLMLAELKQGKKTLDSMIIYLEGKIK
jgi:hypothetical protein